MSSESRPPPRGRGSVAARIQAFQDIQDLEDSTLRFKQMPRVMTQALESGTIVGHGRRSTTTFASPAGRASRDGNEGARGDGRPPVGGVVHKLHPSMEEKEVYRRPLVRLIARPHTSFGESRNELTEARQRLRSVVAECTEEFQDRVGIRSLNPKAQAAQTFRIDGSNNKVLEELGDMLDDAIEAQAGNHSHATSQMESPRTVKRWNSMKAQERCKSQAASVRRSQSVARAQQESSVNPESSLESSRIDYERYQSSNNESVDAKVAEEVVVSPSPQSFVSKDSSPVRERAAMFERLERRSTIPKQADSPPIPPALPQFLSSEHRRRFRPGLSPGTGHTYRTAPQSAASTGPTVASPTSQAADKTERELSNRWSFNWGLLNKALVATPQQVDVHTPVDLESDEHKLPTGNSQSKVQSLLGAADEGSVTVREMKGSRNQYNQIEPKKLPPLQVPIEEQAKMVAGNTEKESVDVGRGFAKESCASPRRSTMKTLSKPANPDLTLDVLETVPYQPQTPKRDFTADKEIVTTPKPGNDGGYPWTKRSGSRSPTKKDVGSTSSTPMRGRRMTRHGTSGAAYGVEKRFALSKSRSRSGGVRVSVEVRTSPERKDEAIVVVRANVEPLHDEDEEQED